MTPRTISFITKGITPTVPFGGVLMIPTMSKPLAGVIAIVVNAVVTGLVLAIIKKEYKLH
jgi:PTS system fructose-specific IIC component